MRKILFFILLCLYAASVAQAQNAPITLRAPWDDGDWWQPSTYDGHPAPGTHYATDFNLANSNSISPNWPFATEGSDLGRNIRAAHSGTVTQILKANSGGYGNLIKLRSSDNNQYETYYAHLNDFVTANGAFVNAGDIIGHCGATGNVTGPHLHFELHRNGTAQLLDGITLSGQSINIDYSRVDGFGRNVGRPIQAKATGPLTDIYVSTSGNDGNSGTSGSPFATVTKAVSAASSTAPTVIHVKGGNYHVTNLTIHKNIRIVNDGGGPANIGR